MSSTPDALWSAPSLRVLRPAAVSCTAVSRGRLLDRVSLSVPVGMRLLVVGEPDESASMLIRVLAGLSRPRRGRVEIAGLADPSASGWGRRVAHLGPEPGIPAWMTPREVLALAAQLVLYAVVGFACLLLQGTSVRALRSTTAAARTAEPVAGLPVAEG